nr:unnamed protein product [Callosobruchus analis]
MSNRPLTDKELEDIVNNMSDIEYESDIDDSVGDPDYENSDSLDSTDSETNIGPADIPLESETLSDNDESSSDQSDNNRGVGEVGSHEVQVIWNDCTGKENNPNEQPVASRVVLELMEPLLDCGRLLVTDNFYTSVSLAHALLDRKTHLIGTLRKNRKYNPKPVTDAKLEKGAMIARESNTHVVVGKWKDKREVLFLTTEAVPKITDVQTKRGAVKKPSTIAKYNSIKSFIDVSDQKASYSTAVRRGIKWYRKVAIELLTNTAPVNAHIAYQSVTKKTINITKFREEITNKIFNDRHNAVNIPSEEASRNHKFIETKSRGRCTRCYKVNSDRNGRGYAMKNTPRTTGGWVAHWLELGLGSERSRDRISHET